MSRSNQPSTHGRTQSTGKPRRAPTAGTDAQQQLLDAAVRLFYAQGIRAVGIDAVVEQAGVNKMSLYRQFASKDQLVVAYLNRMDAEYWQRFERSTAQHPGQPARQLKQFFEDLAARAPTRLPRLSVCQCIVRVFRPRASGAPGRRTRARTARRVACVAR
ncbi:TetR family transcriptional regulator [Mycetohabitans endofungorum]|uniref:TetR family transcriptional regulator n=1 Tax=Mycetohabitans endofungorum TaxID=417203 RepID=A0A2P5K9A7_9BURK|nr:TetR family transcriptional regulator [Mycetohabitans endofungorum]